MPIQPVSGEIKAQPLNDNFSYLDSELANVNLGPGGYFNSEAELKAAYPNGSDRFFVVGEYAYYWKNNWTQGQKFQAADVKNKAVMHTKVSDGLANDILLVDETEKEISFPTDLAASNDLNEFKTWLLTKPEPKTLKLTKVSLKTKKAAAKFSLSAVRIINDTKVEILDSRIYNAPINGANTVLVDFTVPVGCCIGFSGETRFSHNGSDFVYQIDRSGLSAETGVYDALKLGINVGVPVSMRGYEVEPVKTLKAEIDMLNTDVYAEGNLKNGIPIDLSGSTNYWDARKFVYNKPFEQDSIIKSVRAKGYLDSSLATISVCEKISDTKFKINKVFSFTTSKNYESFDLNISVKKGEYIATGGNLIFGGRSGDLGTYQLVVPGNSLNAGVFSIDKLEASTVRTNATFEIRELVSPKKQFEMLREIGGNSLGYVNKLPKKLLCFGDSITFGLGSTDEVEKSYPAVIQKNTNIEVTKQAVSGSRWAHEGTDWDKANCFLTRANAIDFSQFDAAIFWGGTNDWQYNSTLDGVKASVEMVLKKVNSDNPSCQILVLLPMWRVHSTLGDSDFNPNSDGEYLKEYSNAIKEICSKFKVETYDMCYHSGISLLNYQYYLTDGLHPNDLGYEHLANLITKKLTLAFGV